MGGRSVVGALSQEFVARMREGGIGTLSIDKRRVFLGISMGEWVISHFLSRAD